MQNKLKTIRKHVNLCLEQLYKFSKSDNLQYNALTRCLSGTNDQASDVPSIIFFVNFYKLKALKTLIFVKLQKNRK